MGENRLLLQKMPKHISYFTASCLSCTYNLWVFEVSLNYNVLKLGMFLSLGVLLCDRNHLVTLDKSSDWKKTKSACCQTSACCHHYLYEQKTQYGILTCISRLRPALQCLVWYLLHLLCMSVFVFTFKWLYWQLLNIVIKKKFCLTIVMKTQIPESAKAKCWA